MATLHFVHRTLDLACDLDAAGASTRATEWRRLRDTASLGAEPIPGGARMWLHPDAWEAAVALARAEASCCSFLDLELATDSDQLRLDITSPVPDAAAVIACLSGTGHGCDFECC